MFQFHLQHFHFLGCAIYESPSSYITCNPNPDENQLEVDVSLIHEARTALATLPRLIPEFANAIIQKYASIPINILGNPLDVHGVPSVYANRPDILIPSVQILEENPELFNAWERALQCPIQVLGYVNDLESTPVVRNCTSGEVLVAVDCGLQLYKFADDVERFLKGQVSIEFLMEVDSGECDPGEKIEVLEKKLEALKREKDEIERFYQEKLKERDVVCNSFSL